MRKLGEEVTESLERLPARWFVVQHVREKVSCRSCESISEAPAPFHPIARGRAGPNLLAEVVFGKYGMHLPLNRQSACFAREGIDLDVSTLADWVSNNAAERALRGIAVGRRNWTFAGSDEGGRRAAAMYTLIETAKLNSIDPRAWLADVLARLPGHPASRIHELLPWNWQAPAAISAAA
jgi:transposase